MQWWIVWTSHEEKKKGTVMWKSGNFLALIDERMCVGASSVVRGYGYSGAGEGCLGLVATHNGTVAAPGRETLWWREAYDGC